ncbi:hypothetical protein [Lentzea aerocolonigenes]|uniref:hypothetical protein n=1 Tax=Lentzea aerocolonigenes TaxID=68170 RepID=UPI0004C31F3F|nr:hypothetical protein [Lentzea aerocolonigenes]MCP2241591.1 hypothetical protein [Lentzea aerocolonigenes]
MNEFTVIREHGPQPTPLSDEVLAKARADLFAEIHAAPRPVRLRRRTVVVAAAAAAVAVVAGIMATSTPSPTYEAPVLVRFHMPVPPPELKPVPEGVTGPRFTAEPGWLAAVYSDNKPGAEMSAIYVIASNRPGNDGVPTTYDGKPAVLHKVDQDEPTFHEVALSWERSPGRWIKLTGVGRFADEQIVRSLAGTLADTDKRLSLDIGVAPAGWELYAFKDAGPDGTGAVTSLRDPANPDRTIHVSTTSGLVPDYGQTVEGGPVDTIPVSVHGRRGDLVQIPGKQWMLQAPLPDGRTFQLQVPADFTQQQVIELAEGVS